MTVKSILETVFVVAIGCICPDVSRAEPCWLAYGDCRPLKDPRTGEDRDLTKQGSFGSKYLTEEKNNLQIGQVEYLLLMTADSRTFGYVDKRYVIGREAILQPLPSPVPGVLPPPRIHRKVRLSNSQMYLATRPDDKQLKVVNVYSRPDEDDRYKVGEFKLSTLMFVFGETEDFFLLGHNAEFDASESQPRSVGTVLKGWVRKDRCIEWNTRQALEWNWRNHTVRSLPAVIFSELNDKENPAVYDRELTANRLNAYLGSEEQILGLIGKGANKQQIDAELAKHGVFSREPFEIVEGKLQLKRMQPTALRMPLLDQALKLSDFEDGEDGHYAWELAATALSGAGEITVPDTSPADQFERLDVVLVIDATISMREEIVASLIAVMELAEKLKDLPMTVQFAFVFFRDKQDNPANWIETLDYAPLPPADQFNARNVILAYREVKDRFRLERPDSRESIQASEQALNRLLAASSQPFFESLKKAYAVQAIGGGSPPESVFQGLEHALTELENDQSKALRLAIVIGDRGDNGGDAIISDKLVQSLVGRRQIPCLLTVLNVDGVNGEKLESDFQPVVSQLNKIFNAGFPAGKQFTAAQVIRLYQDQNEVAARVGKLVTDVTNQARIERVKLIQAAETGDYSQLTPLGQKALEASGVNIGQLQQQRGEVFRKGLTNIKIQAKSDLRTGTLSSDAVRVSVLMTKTEVFNLHAALNSLVGTDIIDQQVGDGGTLKGLIVKATQAVVGDGVNVSGVSFRQALSTITGVPATSSLLESAEKIDELLKPENKKDLMKELERLTEVRRRLNDALNDRYSEFSWVDGKDKDGFPVREMVTKAVHPFGTGTQPKRGFQFGGVGEEYLWIDLELEYP